MFTPDASDFAAAAAAEEKTSAALSHQVALTCRGSATVGIPAVSSAPTHPAVELQPF